MSWHPADRLVRDAQRRGRSRRRSRPRRAAAGARSAQEVAGLRALDDPVVVGRGQRDDLADRQPGQRLLAGALELGRVLHRADADDRALARPSAAAPSARCRCVPGLVSEIVVPAKSSTVELAVAGPPDDVLVGRSRTGAKSIVSAPLMLGTSSCRVPSGLGRSIARPRLTCSGRDHGRLAVDLGVAGFISGIVGQRLDHRVADQVGEARPCRRGRAEVVVDDDAVVDQQLGRDGAHAGRGRHRRGWPPCW